MLDINRYLHVFLEQMPSCGQEIAHLVPCVVRPPHHVCLTHLNMSSVLKVSDSSWIVGFSDRWCRDNRNLPNISSFQSSRKTTLTSTPSPSCSLALLSSKVDSSSSFMFFSTILCPGQKVFALYCLVTSGICSVNAISKLSSLWRVFLSAARKAGQRANT